TAAGIGGVTGRVARTCEVNLNVLHRWRRELREDREKVFPGIGPAAGERKPGGGLERKIGQQALEIDFLRSCLPRVEEQRRVRLRVSTLLAERIVIRVRAPQTRRSPDALYIPTTSPQRTNPDRRL